ncbi:MAG: DegT/DnrJ/EryC1/StrS family aminotransferase [candidate division WOR-3 bacterium]|nr:DegT/DnrJ/EryC1/StrS family aminotransferase [candidate division WOR-3 bacterium]
MQEKITIGTTSIGRKSKKLINEILNSGRISMGKYVAQLEKEFARYHQIKECIAVATGTDAVTIAVASCINLNSNKKSPEVILPALTFIASANGIVNAGAKPVFVDITLDTYQIDVEQIEEKITSNTLALLPVHLLGHPADMDTIIKIADKHNLSVIEDAAEAHGAVYREKKVGTIGIAGAFSFYVAHIITTGEGGAIITNDEEFAALARSLRAHGRACKCHKCVLNISSQYCPLRFKYEKEEGFDPRFYFEYIGYSSKMNELEAALGIEQIESLDKIINKRRKNFFYLNQHLLDLEEFFYFLKEKEDVKISPLVYPLTIRKGAPFNRQDITIYLEKRGIETRPIFGCIPTQQPAYRFMNHRYGDFPNAEYVGENGFYFGVHQNLSQQDLDYIIEEIHQFVKLR